MWPQTIGDVVGRTLTTAKRSSSFAHTRSIDFPWRAVALSKGGKVDATLIGETQI
jgi:hypothetical protein